MICVPCQSAYLRNPQQIFPHFASYLRGHTLKSRRLRLLHHHMRTYVLCTEYKPRTSRSPNAAEDRRQGQDRYHMDQGKTDYLLSTELETGEVYECISYKDITIFLCTSSSVHCTQYTVRTLCGGVHRHVGQEHTSSAIFLLFAQSG